LADKLLTCAYIGSDSETQASGTSQVRVRGQGPRRRAPPGPAAGQSRAGHRGRL